MSLGVVALADHIVGIVEGAVAAAHFPRSVVRSLSISRLAAPTDRAGTKHIKGIRGAVKAAVPKLGVRAI